MQYDIQPMRKIVIPNEILFAEVERQVSEGCNAEIFAKGNSMRPFIRSDRTRICLSPCDTSLLQPGDVVLFRYRGHHVMHRIINRNGDEFVLAGDGNCGQIEHCTSEDIVARLTSVITKRGKIIGCDTRLWRSASALWVGLPLFVRRCLLGVMWRIGIR